MEKIMFASDELTGLIWAAAKNASLQKVSWTWKSPVSRKKFKDKRFAAGCSRDVIKDGAEMLGWELTELFDKTIQAMRSCEASAARECGELAAQ